MALDSLASFLTGAAVTLSLGSPVEWAIHKYLLHAKKRNFITKYPARAHNDVHHAGYSGPEHYYRDVTNEHVTIHFSPGDVALIAGLASVVGAAKIGLNSMAQGKLPGKEDLAFLGGFLGGTMFYYSLYELSHHNMHVIGERRLAINKVLGDNLQEGFSDGKLRFSKPLLDDACKEVERIVDKYTGKDHSKISISNKSLIKRFEEQINYNAEKSLTTDGPHITRKDPKNILEDVTQTMINREDNYRKTLSPYQNKVYSVKRGFQRFLRSFPPFEYIDNHHFLHHYNYKYNLNVVFPFMDIVMGTKLDSSRKSLEENLSYWICPNSPDKVPFNVETA